MTAIKALDTDQRLLDDAARSDAAEGISQGLEDSTNNQVRPVTDFFAEFEARHGIVMPYPRK